MSPSETRQRIWEIDFLRGLSIILMVGYHLLFDLGEFRGVERFLGFSTDLTTTAWKIAQMFFATLFIVLSGISSTLSRSNIRRGLRLLAVALALTLGMYLIAVLFHLFDPSNTVIFGILHCLAVSMLIYGVAFEKCSPFVMTLTGAAVVGLGAALPALKRAMALRFDWLLPLGLHSATFSSFDYFPLIPWFGIFLVGAALGRTLYAPKRSLLPLGLPVSFVNIAGRHSLLIYIAHQPVIWGVLYLLGPAK